MSSQMLTVLQYSMCCLSTYLKATTLLYDIWSANYIRPSGFLCCRPDGLELTTDWVSRSVCRFWCFSAHC